MAAVLPNTHTTPLSRSSAPRRLSAASYSAFFFLQAQFDFSLLTKSFVGELFSLLQVCAVAESVLRSGFVSSSFRGAPPLFPNGLREKIDAPNQFFSSGPARFSSLLRFSPSPSCLRFFFLHDQERARCLEFARPLPNIALQFFCMLFFSRCFRFALPFRCRRVSV